MTRERLRQFANVWNIQDNSTYLYRDSGICLASVWIYSFANVLNIQDTSSYLSKRLWLTFSLLVRNLSMFAIMCLLTFLKVVSWYLLNLVFIGQKKRNQFYGLTLAMTSLNSRVMPAFMMRGFLQIALAILSSTRRPSASWCYLGYKSFLTLGWFQHLVLSIVTDSFHWCHNWAG